jgi:uncharacterized protein (TIGR00369 family)
MKKLVRRREVSWEDPIVGAAPALDLSGLDYQAYTTLELKVNLVKALTVSTPSVVATGQVIGTGRRVVTASGQITGPDGTLYARATTACLVFEPHRQSRSGGNGHGR